MEKVYDNIFNKNKLSLKGENNKSNVFCVMRDRLLKKIGTVQKESSSSEDIYRASRRELLSDLDETLAELRYARNCFENAREPEIIEACVYEIKSAEARYNYLLRKAKESKLSQTRSLKLF